MSENKNLIKKIKSVLDRMKSSNLKVDENLVKWQKLLEFSGDKDTLFKQLDEWSDDPEFNLQFNNKVPYTSIIVGILLTILILFLLQGSVLIYLAILPTALTTYGLITRKANKLNKNLFRNSLNKVAKFNYNIDFNQHYSDGKQEFNRNFFMDSFNSFFCLGNYSNEIRDIATGFWTIDDIEIPHTIYHYHYVDKEVSTDKDGNRKVTYHKYNKWGIFVFNLPVNGIAIFKKTGLFFKSKNKYFPVQWTTSSIDFNKSFSLAGVEEIKLAKFFTPSMLMKIEEFFVNKSLSDASIVFSNSFPIMHVDLKNIDPFVESYDKDSIKDMISLRKVLKSYRLGQLEFVKNHLSPLLNKILR